MLLMERTSLPYASALFAGVAANRKSQRRINIKLTLMEKMRIKIKRTRVKRMRKRLIKSMKSRVVV
jgi:hypothetical protein